MLASRYQRAVHARYPLGLAFIRRGAFSFCLVTKRVSVQFNDTVVVCVLHFFEHMIDRALCFVIEF